MASGNTLVTFGAHDRTGPASNPATLDTRNEVPVLDYDETTNEYADFVFTVPSAYTSNAGVTAKITWGMTGATPGDVLWSAALKPMRPGIHDVDTATFTTAVAGSSSFSGASGMWVTKTLAFTSAHFGSMVAGDNCHVRLMRDAANSATDTLSGDAELLSLEIYET